ncbi:hypothetical protein MalM25_06290 [Planctomycetes bacterium MalM25]|nr:hypothetical protein MalM25_06290 [Planctomycetes bacterium MalM25]
MSERVSGRQKAVGSRTSLPLWGRARVGAPRVPTSPPPQPSPKGGGSSWLLAALCLLPSAYSFADAEHLEDEDNPSLTIIRMEVTPADEAVPAFKHRLIYDLHERLPGNRPQWYARTYPEEAPGFRAWVVATSRDHEAFEEYYQSGVPVRQVDWSQFEVPLKVAKSFYENYLVPAARRRDCDWGLHSESVTGPELIQFLLPEFQGSREFARMGNAATRQAIAEERYEDAITYLRTQYQLSRDVAEEPFLVCSLVGIAISGIANVGATDLIAAPGSPNLYWALSELPSPPVSIAETFNAELAIAERMFPVLSDAESVERTGAQWNEVWRDLVQGTQDGTINSRGVFRGSALDVAPVLFGLSGYTHAKGRLLDWGHEPASVEAMSVGQVLTIYTARVVKIAADEYRKANVTDIPFSDLRRIGEAADNRLREMRPFHSGQNREIVPIADLLLPAIQAARSAEVRIARDVAALRVIEALRMHAARNNDRWPRSLEDVTCVPIPLNPATDKPFLYHRDGRTAVLELPDWEGFPGYSRRYEITIKP